MRRTQIPSLAAIASVPVLVAGCLTEQMIVAAPVAEFEQVTDGMGHACGLTAGGVAACWSESDPRPVVVSGTVEFASISTLWNHTCGISTDDRAYCWGINDYGQLGNVDDVQTCPVGAGGAFCAPNPIAVQTDVLFSTVEVGTLYTCGLDLTGTVYCWGDNSFGQLGALSEFICGGDLGGAACSPEPLPVGNGLTFASLSVGAAHACALTPAGTAYCWGNGLFGRLGNGGTVDSPTPVAVGGNLTLRFISVGGGHTCGITTSEELYCWGTNSDMQLGSIENDLTQRCGRLPDRCVLTPSRALTDRRFQTLTAGGSHTCGLVDTGDVYCWGLNEFGALLLPNRLRSAEPVPIQVDRRFTQVSAGAYTTCGVTSESAVVCWPFGSPLATWTAPVR